MAYQYKFEKILQLKEREKEMALESYNESVKKFEEAARHLYSHLKKKEDMEAQQTMKLFAGISVQEIQHYQYFIGNFDKVIDHYQKMVVRTRNYMNYFQERLIEKNIEVKKYEKMKEKDHLHYTENEKWLEAKQMDDISIQHYMARGN
ncbi:flagellar biosynthesis chaperone FliJ [Bacillaceae bacterium Marseille-Q3522]|nr:flagellar biosynthesis chaperone FliJ [Bacillaceae bacterium Marseille-Q3522]